MRLGIGRLWRAWLLVATVLALAAPAAAQRYRVIDGQVLDAGAGEAAALAGTVDFGLSPLAVAMLPGPGVDQFQISGFDLVAGHQAFAPSVPHQLDGVFPALVSLRLGDVLGLEGDEVRELRMSAGGVVVAQTDDTVTFRDWTFAAGGGRAIGREASGGGLPLRFDAVGTVTAVDRRYEIQTEEDCRPVVTLPPSLPPVAGGSVIRIGGGGNLTLRTIESGPVGEGAGLTLRSAEGDAAPAGGDIVLGGDGSIGVSSSVEHDAVTVELGGVPLRGVLVGEGLLPVTLEDLGITAPAGATIVTGTDGRVTVASTGDLVVAGGRIEIEGLSVLRLVSDTTIQVLPPGLELPPDVRLELVAAGSVEIDGPLTAPERVVVLDPGVLVLCPMLRLLDTEVVSRHHLELEAALERPVELALAAPRGRARAHPALLPTLVAAVLGSDALDVRDVDPRSLRFGPDRVPPARRGRWGLRIGYRDVDRDGHQDLVARFGTSGIALGDEEVCLTGATVDGPAIAGCTSLAESGVPAADALRAPVRSSARRGSPTARERGRRRAARR